MTIIREIPSFKITRMVTQRCIDGNTDITAILDVDDCSMYYGYHQDFKITIPNHKLDDRDYIKGRLMTCLDSYTQLSEPKVKPVRHGDTI